MTRAAFRCNLKAALLYFLIFHHSAQYGAYTRDIHRLSTAWNSTLPGLTVGANDISVEVIYSEDGLKAL
jgi:hypothetical protein